ncbi:MAG: hypothetical protein U9Q79_01745, partial [Candidatus Hydrogenedentes bacterium]|nr:hypothetical protein [Candidatus Hydrogenedentota bacterium]
QAKKVIVENGRLVQGLEGGEHNEAVRETVMATEPGGVSEPLELGDIWYVFGVSETPAQVHAFKEVKSQAERMLRAEKQQEQFQALVAETLQARNVQLYAERLKEAPAKE